MTDSVCIDVTLAPGEFFFGDGDLRIGTLLGSCVAITLWHPRSRSGGMCHFLLPERAQSDHAPRHDTGPNRELDGRYADDAVEMFLRAIDERGHYPQQYSAKIFGGGRQFVSAGQRNARLDVPARNIEAAHRLLAMHGLVASATHLGGSGPRNVVLDLNTGDAWVRHTEIGIEETP